MYITSASCHSRILQWWGRTCSKHWCQPSSQSWVCCQSSSGRFWRIQNCWQFRQFIEGQSTWSSLEDPCCWTWRSSNFEDRHVFRWSFSPQHRTWSGPSQSPWRCSTRTNVLGFSRQGHLQKCSFVIFPFWFDKYKWLQFSSCPSFPILKFGMKVKTWPKITVYYTLLVRK